MALAHFSLGKVAYWLIVVLSLVFIALDPTMQAALVAGGINLAALIVALLIRKDVKAMSINVDGNFKRLLDDRDKERAEHAVTAEKLSHAEGKAEGATEERDRDSKGKD
jgi:hypothetical protein